MNQVPLLHKAEAELLARKKVNGDRSMTRRMAKSVKDIEMDKDGGIEGDLKYDTLLRYLSHLVAMGAGVAVVRYQCSFSLIGILLIIFVIDHMYLGARRIIWAKMAECETKRKRAAQQHLKKKALGKDKLELRREYLLCETRVELLDDRVVDGTVAYRIFVSHQQEMWDIWHVFSDFEALRETLSHLKKAREVSWNIPSLGSHRMINMTLTSEGRMKRKDKLRAFVAAIILKVEISELDEVRRFFHLPPLSAKAAEQAKILASRDSASNTKGSKRIKDKSIISDVPILGSGYDYISDLVRTAMGKEEGGEKSSSINEPPHHGVVDSNAQSAVELDPFHDQPDYLRSYFEDSGSGNQYRVRGSNYLNDRLKVLAGPSALHLVHASMYKSEELVYHISSMGLCKRRLDSYIASTPEGQDPPFLFIVNVMVPGDPIVNIVLWWAFDKQMADKLLMSHATKSMLERYAAIPGSVCESLEDKEKRVHSSSYPEADDCRVSEGLFPASDFRNERFKLIPNIVEGPFIVRKAVGNTPALLGKKLTQRYFRGAHYIETDVDVSSSVVALNVVGLCRGYAKQIIVDIGICLEGRAESELPEQMIGVVRLLHPEVHRAEPLEC